MNAHAIQARKRGIVIRQDLDLQELNYMALAFGRRVGGAELLRRSRAGIVGGCQKFKRIHRGGNRESNDSKVLKGSAPIVRIDLGMHMVDGDTRYRHGTGQADRDVGARPDERPAVAGRGLRTQHVEGLGRGGGRVVALRIEPRLHRAGDAIRVSQGQPKNRLVLTRHFTRYTLFVIGECDFGVGQNRHRHLNADHETTSRPESKVGLTHKTIGGELIELFLNDCTHPLFRGLREA